MERNECAADWLQRLDDPDIKEEEIQSWLEWFGASDQNRKAFEDVQSLRRSLREMPAQFRQELPRKIGLRVPSPVPRGRVRVGASWPLAASIAAVALTAAVWWKLQSHPTQIVYTAPAGHHRTVALEDSSSLVLGADASVAVAYSSERRVLNVKRGEAYFEVRHDPRRPFMVQVGNVRVTALGTAFNVQRKSDNVTVTVTQGKVSVSSAAHERAKPVLLAVGQRAVVPLDNPHRVAVAAKTSAPGWDHERADFIDAPLSEVLPVINRYAPARLVINDPRVADFTYSGTIYRTHIDEWIASLPQVYPIRTVPLEDGAVSLVSRQAPVR